MSQIHAMSDDQVSTELKKMTAFIKQEALEKAKEITLKADEEFAIEKSRLVREETSAIDAEYDKKFKQAGMSQQITRSTVANRTRLRVLGARQELVDELFERAREEVGKVGGGGGEKGKGKKDDKGGDYESICKGLVLEGLYKLNEKHVQVRCRKKDVDVVKKAADAASKEYKDNMGKESKVEIDEKNPLPDEGSGGISVSGTQGRIDINNSFEERLKILEIEALPQLRLMLFGENANRTFKN